MLIATWVLLTSQQFRKVIEAAGNLGWLYFLKFYVTN